MVEEYEPSEVARMIEARRTGVRISVRTAAKNANLSEGRWRQIAKGYQATGGVRVPVNAPVDTLLRMALAVELDPDDLDALGEKELAGELRAAIAEKTKAATQVRDGITLQEVIETSESVKRIEVEVDELRRRVEELESWRRRSGEAPRHDHAAVVTDEVTPPEPAEDRNV